MIEETLAHSAEALLFTPFVSVTRRTGERRTAYFPLSSLSSPSSILDLTWMVGGGGGVWVRRWVLLEGYGFTAD